MHDIQRIVLYFVCFLASAYALRGIDFHKAMRKGSETRIQLLYIFLSLGLGYVVAQFLMGLSFAYFM